MLTKYKIQQNNNIFNLKYYKKNKKNPTITNKCNERYSVD
jgi:hypothetical protein